MSCTITLEFFASPNADIQELIGGTIVKIFIGGINSMGLLDIIKKVTQSTSKQLTYVQILSTADYIDENEKRYYQQDPYYSDKAFEGTIFEKRVITFEERVTTSFPSSTGLYVPEILMLHFCKSFPNPKNGYPAYWWFEYGVRNVGAMLRSLEERGYIEIDSKTGKYKITSKGKAEQEENEYVYFTHKNSQDVKCDAWKMNELLGNGDKSNYLEVFKQNCEISKIGRYSQQSRIEEVKESPIVDVELLSELQSLDPRLRKLDDSYNKASDSYRQAMDRHKEAMDRFIEILNLRDAQYKVDGCLPEYILFWEDNWKHERPLLGAHWAFMLPDLYIKAKRYEDALRCMNRLRMDYPEKTERYIAKINDRIVKSKK